MRRKPINPTSMSKISETSASIGVPHSHKKSFLRLFKGQHWASRIDLGVGSTRYQCEDAKKNKKWMDNIYCTPRKNNMEAKNNLIEKQKKTSGRPPFLGSMFIFWKLKQKEVEPCYVDYIWNQPPIHGLLPMMHVQAVQKKEQLLQSWQPDGSQDTQESPNIPIPHHLPKTIKQRNLRCSFGIQWNQLEHWSDLVKQQVMPFNSPLVPMAFPCCAWCLCVHPVAPDGRQVWFFQPERDMAKLRQVDMSGIDEQGGSLFPWFSIL